jgi:hypothetical protein
MVKIITLVPAEVFGWDCGCGSFARGHLTFDSAEEDAAQHFSATLIRHELMGWTMPAIVKEILISG